MDLQDMKTDIILPYGTLPKDVIDLGTVFGPFFLAQCFNWALYGALVLQVYIYWLRFPKDLTYIKYLVASVFFVDSFSIVLVTHAAWRVLVSHWGDVNILHDLDWTWASVPVSSGVVSSMVQMFFVWRIWKLSKSFTMPFIITLVVLAQCAFAVRTGFIAYYARNFHYIRDLLPAFWLGGSMLADILISGTLAVILWRGKTGFKDTDGVILRLIRLTIEAAAVPTIAAAAKLGLIYSAHDNKHLVFCVVLARLYSNSLLAMLNCRDPLFGGGSTPNTMAGAARLSTGSSTGSGFLRKFGDKFTRSTGSSPSSPSSQNGNQLMSLDNTYGDKILIHKTTVSRSHHDIDLEGARDFIVPDRSSQLSLDTLDSPSKPTFNHNGAEFPAFTSPNSDYVAFPRNHVQYTRPLSQQPPMRIQINGGGIYETSSQLTPPFAPDGSLLQQQQKTTAFAADSPVAMPVLAKPANSYDAGRLPFE